MNRWKNCMMNIAGSFLLALGVYAFTVPFDIAVSGVTGMSVIVNKLSGIDLSVTVWAVNMICLPLGYFFVGRELAAGSVLSSFVYPFALELCRRIPGLDTLCGDIALAAVMSGVLSGLGIGLVMRSGGSTGGVDILCILFNKRLGIPVSTIMYAIDTAIMLGQLPFCDTDRVLYGAVGVYLMTYLIDRVLTLGTDKYQVTIITEKYEELRRLLLQNDFGVTMQLIETGLEKENQKAVTTTILSRELRKVQDIAAGVDETAFMTIQRVTDARGRGYTLRREYRGACDRFPVDVFDGV